MYIYCFSCGIDRPAFLSPAPSPVRQGTESVKEFLVGKLKETEAALKRSLDEKGLTLRQSASDQEVISFLDSRTQVYTRL